MSEDLIQNKISNTLHDTFNVNFTTWKIEDEEDVYIGYANCQQEKKVLFSFSCVADKKIVDEGKFYLIKDRLSNKFIDGDSFICNLNKDKVLVSYIKNKPEEFAYRHKERNIKNICEQGVKSLNLLIKTINKGGCANERPN